MSKHHPGPWVIEPDISTVEVFTEQGDKGGFGCSWLACSGPGPRETLEANAARIVACVNALEGIDDPEAFVEAAKHITRELTDGILAHGLSSDQRELLFSLVWAAGGRR